MTEIPDEMLQDLQLARAINQLGPARRIGFCLEVLVSTLLDVGNVEQHRREEIQDALDLVVDEIELGGWAR